MYTRKNKKRNIGIRKTRSQKGGRVFAPRGAQKGLSSEHVAQQHAAERRQLEQKQIRQRQQQQQKQQQQREEQQQRHQRELAQEKNASKRAQLQRKHEQERAALARKHANKDKKLTRHQDSRVKAQQQRHKYESAKSRPSVRGSSGVGSSGMGSMGLGSSGFGSLGSSLSSDVAGLGSELGSGLGELGSGLGSGNSYGSSGNGSSGNSSGFSIGSSGNTASTNGTMGNTANTNGAIANKTMGNTTMANTTMANTTNGYNITAKNIAEAKVLPGVPVEVPLQDYQGPDIPGTYKPIVRDAITGDFLTYFMIQTPEGAKFYKLYDISEQAIKDKIAQTIKDELLKSSPFPQVLDSMSTMRLQLKDNKAIAEADFDRLDRMVNTILDPNEKDIAVKYLAVLRSDIDRILEEEDTLERIISKVE